MVLKVLQAVETWVQTLPQEEAYLAQPPLEIAQQVKEQDVQVDEAGKASLIKGVAKDRRISVEDGQMRHGRKSRSVRVDEYKRHVLQDLDTGLIRAVGITPANAPEASVTEAISADLDRQEVCLKELHIDRAYLSSHLVRERPDELEVYCKAWPVHQGKGFHKQAFVLDWQRQTIQCPAKQEMPFAPGGTVHFPKETCDQCPLKSQCTTSSKGRSVSIHPDEALLIELRQRQQTPQGRAKLRERVAIEHTLAHVGWWQGRRARYRGVRKNLFDLRRSPSSTICTSWLVPSSFRLSFKMLLDYLTDALAYLCPSLCSFPVCRQESTRCVFQEGPHRGSSPRSSTVVFHSLQSIAVFRSHGK